MSIEFDKLRGYLPMYLSDRFHIQNTRKNFPCPVCDSGHRTPCASYDERTERIKCFSCDWTGDIFDLMSVSEGLSVQEAAKAISERYEGKPIKASPVKQKEPITADFSEYILACAADEHAADYFKSRGISEKVVADHRLGYDAEKRLAIIPYSKAFYIGRATVEGVGKYYRPAGVTKTSPYNARRLLESTREPLFCAEGEINALSLESIGLSSIGLGSSSDWRVLIDFIDRHKVNRPLIICLDFDAAGQASQESLCNALAERNIPYKAIAYPFAKQDINDTLRTKKEELIEYMTKEREDFIKEISSQESNSPLHEYNGLSALESLLKRVQNPDFKPTPTGFSVLDKKLGGGLYSGLALIAAAPSEGKTTFAMQIGENIAEREERDLLVFSFEMSREQLTAKTISRLTYENASQNSAAALTAIEFMQSFKPDCGLDGAKLMSRVPAIDRYRDKIGKYIHIFDDCEPTTAGIMARIEAWERVQPVKKKAPIIIIDYLQLLDSGDKEFVAGCKDITLALKQYAIAKDTIVFAISAVNRDSQRNGTSLTSAYGSSFAEYSSDYMFTLDFTAIKKKFGEETKEQLKQKPIREMTVTIQKNRMGTTGEMIDFRYAAPYNHFSDTPTETQLAEDVHRIEEPKKGGVIR